MDGLVTLVWMAPDAPDARQARAISAWALGRAVKLTLPPDERPASIASPAGDAVPEDVETLLDRARDAIAARDAEGADRALSTAEAALRAHPELPQAAWLMAEVERCRSTRWSRMPSTDTEATDRAWRRAEALDGGRTAGIVEKGSASRPAAATIRVALDAAGVRQAWLDGKPVPATVETLAGPHALVVTWGGAPVWARWIEVPAGSSTVAVDAPSPSPCSLADVSRARVEGSAVRAPGVRCPRWVAAAPGDPRGDVLLAACEAEGCAPLLPWRAPEPWTWTPPPPGGPSASRGKSGWPAWATWGVVGAGAGIVAGAAVILVDALRPAQAETRFVNGGLITE